MRIFFKEENMKKAHLGLNWGINHEILISSKADICSLIQQKKGEKFYIIRVNIVHHEASGNHMVAS